MKEKFGRITYVFNYTERPQMYKVRYFTSSEEERVIIFYENELEAM